MTPGAISNVLHNIACKIRYMFLKISCQYLWRLYEMLQLDFSFTCSEWPWTFQNDLKRPWSTIPSLKEHLLSITSIPDERFRYLYELGWTDTPATVCTPKKFSGNIKTNYSHIRQRSHTVINQLRQQKLDKRNYSHFWQRSHTVIKQQQKLVRTQLLTDLVDW
jgi:hypothetical protein